MERRVTLWTRTAPLLTVFVAVALNIASAVVLKLLADIGTTSVRLLAAGLAAVLVLNALRVVVWGYAHLRFPISRTYPLTSLFFPLMLVVSGAFGEAVEFSQYLGSALIFSGVIWLGLRDET